MSEQLINDLKQAIAMDARKPLIVCGAGVSIAATNSEAPSWAELIKSGIAKVVSLDPEEEDWATYARSRLKKSRAEDWIKIADEVTRALGGSNNAEFAEWIAGEVSQLRAMSRGLVDAIASLGCPVATTNYDDVLAHALDVPPITWDDPDQVARFLRGQLSGVLHLHGHWRRPGTVVLGSASYDALLDDSKKAVLSSYAALDRSAVYIGCSADGLSDPDFTHLARFLSEWQQSAPRSYWLVKEDQRSGAKAFLSDVNPRVFPIAFGSDHPELTTFLRSLATKSEARPAVVPSFTPIDQQEPCPEIFGREAELKTLENALISGRHALLGGGPGMGKTALAVSAAYRPEVRARFGDGRIFVSLEGESEPRALVAALASALGLSSSGEEASLIRQIQLAAKGAPLLAILDNAEGLFDANRREAERVLGLIGQIEGLTLMLTIRGVPPRLPAAVIIDDLLKLTPEAARSAFAAIAGPQVELDPDLDPLVETLDGHALSIDLVAARARSGGSLSGVREAWKELRADFLIRIGQAEGRLTSVGASFALSLNSKFYKDNPLAKRVLSLLSLLPAGLAEDMVPRLIGERAKISKKKAVEAIEVLRTLRLVEKRLDQRLRMLTPLREASQFYVTIMASDKIRLISHYNKIMRSLDKIGTAEWEATRSETDNEVGNFEPMLRLSIGVEPYSEEVYRAIIGAAKYAKFSGQLSMSLFEYARDKIYKTNNPIMIATILTLVAEISAEREDAGAGEHYSTGLHYAKAYNLTLTQGNCLNGLGRLEASLSRNDEAERYFQLSLKKYRVSDSLLGQANSLREIAQLHQRRGRDLDAIDLFEQAAMLYDRLGSQLGRTITRYFVDELKGKDLVTILEVAIGSFRRLGVSRSEASFLPRLALELQAHGRFEIAKEKLRRSLDISQNIGDLMTESSALITRGIILRREGNSFWKSDIDDGFSLLRTKLSDKDLAGDGFCHLQNYISREDSISREAARSAWLKVPRHDLIRHWLDIPIA